MTEEMRNFLHAVDVIARVRGRLQAAGAFRELGVLRGLSVDELDLLVRLELGLECDRSKTQHPVTLHADPPALPPCLPQDTSQRYGTVAA